MIKAAFLKAKVCCTAASWSGIYGAQQHTANRSSQFLFSLLLDDISLWIHNCEPQVREDSSWENQVEPSLAEAAGESILLNWRPTNDCQIARCTH